MVAGALFPFELLAEDRVSSRFTAGLAALGRVVVFGKRGVGLSDPMTDWTRSAQEQWAEDLVVTSRLYRQDAADAGEHSVALVLDELERNLLEIVHSPSRATAANLEEIQRRIDAASLLFKVRVLGDELRQREHLDSPRRRTLSRQTS